ncbi:aldehyde dehydrogenase [Sphingobium lactosutens]|uniref:aldehyde dehydrogenase family protein n=1 Tax=Sphingobium lactosutens TaxID=522773 RepID=UPI0015B85D3C|nr:aldehyde dehydrogenase family protein [Sphingobium lactosutens]NWK99037.1 aldehyde dehydrogenase [Sphingobium lactosutens]
MALNVDLPGTRELFYGGAFHQPKGGYGRTVNPANGEDLGPVAIANTEDVDLAVKAAQRAFMEWRRVEPTQRGALLRSLAERIRSEAEYLGWLDSINTGNPIAEMKKDAAAGAALIDYFAGIAGMAKGSTIPMGPQALNYATLEPLGVVARIVAYNHPLMFLASRLAAPLATGNTVVLKAPDQAPLSAYRLAEIVADILPRGVVNILSGSRECGEALVAHDLVKKVTLIGSTGTGRAILRGAADKIMPTQLELGGKNPFIMCDDADLDLAIDGAIAGMNFVWAGQSCGSTSRCFVHASIYEKVLSEFSKRIPARHRCGDPSDPATTMGSLISKAQFEKVIGFIEDSKAEGARLVCGGGRPAEEKLANGWFVEATVFADVTPRMRLFREEVFGPVLAVIPWEDEDQLVSMVNDSEYGLTAAIWTNDLKKAHRLAGLVEAGYVWINHVGSHFVGTDFGGYKSSGLGREEGFSELIAFTQSKNIHVSLR